MVSVYKFSDPVAFFRAAFLVKQRENPLFSHRCLCRKLGLGSHSFHIAVFKGEKKIPAGRVPAIAKAFALGPEETEYFEILVLRTHAKNKLERALLNERLFALKRPSARRIRIEDKGVYGKWYYLPVWHLARVMKIGSNLAEAGSKLTPAISASQVKEAIAVLVRLGYLRKNPKNGIYIGMCRNLACAPGYPLNLKKRFLKKMIEFGARGVDGIPETQRNITACTVSINSTAYDKIVSILAATRRQVIKVAYETPRPNTVYQLNLQYFPLSKVE